MAVASANSEKIESMDDSSSRRVSDAASDSSSAGPSSTVDPSDRPSLDRSNSSPSPPRLLESQTPQSLRSEEYRQLFRLPPEEVLIQDFNCALQESFLLQGHMYLFVHYICFYSNLFGYETKYEELLMGILGNEVFLEEISLAMKSTVFDCECGRKFSGILGSILRRTMKIILFQEITAVRRAKAAAIFPTAIEIMAGGKKFFFTSFLFRDEAFKLINEGWLQHGNEAKAIMDNQGLLEDRKTPSGAWNSFHEKVECLQELKSDLNTQENGTVVVGTTESSNHPVDELDLSERDRDVSISEDSRLPPNGEAEIVSTSLAVQDNVEEEAEVVLNADCSSSGKTLVWEQEDGDAPKG
ncbi:unnamed protein product [Ilex paraguariensis]|uniref:GRAM domain-containing protein n=1 Tax=Ilex paraguariensis TaxID=185542 RepID=A0ABC8QLQ9_9AQUA